MEKILGKIGSFSKENAKMMVSVIELDDGISVIGRIIPKGGFQGCDGIVSYDSNIDKYYVTSKEALSYLEKLEIINAFHLHKCNVKFYVKKYKNLCHPDGLTDRWIKRQL